MKVDRGSFGSKLGIVLATAGSAVGLGNVWRFPYTTGENGGAAFILIYIGCILLLGIPGMVSEFIVGRHAQANAAKAYDALSNGRPWKFVGYLGILTSTIILGFYAVVAGWCLQYLCASVIGHLSGDAEYVKNYFVAFSCDPLKPTIWGVVFILITHLVIVRGVQKGIERAFETVDAYPSCAVTDTRRCLVSVTRGIRRYPFLAKARLLETVQQRVLGSIGAGILLFVIGNGMSVYIRQLFLEKHQPVAVGRTDRGDRHDGSRLLRTHDIPRCLLSRGEPG